MLVDEVSVGLTCSSYIGVSYSSGQTSWGDLGRSSRFCGHCALWCVSWCTVAGVRCIYVWALVLRWKAEAGQDPECIARSAGWTVAKPRLLLSLGACIRLVLQHERESTVEKDCGMVRPEGLCGAGQWR
jgi:hypothetical protein